MKLDKDSIGQMTQNLTDKAGKAAKSLAAKGKQTISKSKDSVVSKIDLNGDGKVDIEDIITLGLKTPGIRIRRDDFLAKDTVADSSIDGSANVSQKDIVTLLTAMPKPHMKLLAYHKIYCELNEKYGFKTANAALRALWDGHLYLHDGDTATYKSYCY